MCPRSTPRVVWRPLVDASHRYGYIDSLGLCADEDPFDECIP